MICLSSLNWLIIVLVCGWVLDNPSFKLSKILFHIDPQWRACIFKDIFAVVSTMRAIEINVFVESAG